MTHVRPWSMRRSSVPSDTSKATCAPEDCLGPKADSDQGGDLQGVRSARHRCWDTPLPSLTVSDRTTPGFRFLIHPGRQLGTCCGDSTQAELRTLRTAGAHEWYPGAEASGTTPRGNARREAARVHGACVLPPVRDAHSDISQGGCRPADTWSVHHGDSHGGRLWRHRAGRASWCRDRAGRGWQAPCLSFLLT